MFGGYVNGTTDNINDLWQYNPATNEWVWMSGSNSPDAAGFYGAQGEGSLVNAPGARHSSAAWVDSGNNLWLFGGHGYDANASNAFLNDLWKYNPNNKQWVWLGGSTLVNASGIYGTQGIVASNNVPGARSSSTSWIDSAGNFWLFGGANASGSFNDLWKYNPFIQQWTWMSGSNDINASGVYGTQGTAASSNVPGARYSATSWIDSAGNLWLFGGYEFDGSATLAFVNDLWEYTPSNQQWTWMSGSNVTNASGVYGIQGIAASSNVPGARYGSASWIDSAGNLWLFGGYGLNDSNHISFLNDLWKFDPLIQQWTWMSGLHILNASGVYGTQGTANSNNMPGARVVPMSWFDNSGAVWLFGGQGIDSAGTAGYLNDMWKRN